MAKLASIITYEVGEVMFLPKISEEAGHRICSKTENDREEKYIRY